VDETESSREDQLDEPTEAAQLRIILLPVRTGSKRAKPGELPGDALITAFYLEAEQSGHLDGPPYDAARGLRRFSAWLDRALAPADSAGPAGPAVGLADAMRPVITLAVKAIRVMKHMPAPVREELVEALETELEDGPNADKEVTFNCEVGDDPRTAPAFVPYTATPLSAFGYTAIYRRMTTAEMELLQGEQRPPAADRGFYVLDILPATIPGLVGD
jgi:hypothetical protein